MKYLFKFIQSFLKVQTRFNTIWALGLISSGYPQVKLSFAHTIVQY